METRASVDEQIAAGERFEFGKNWRSFLNVIDEARVQQAMLSIQKLLIAKQLPGNTFLDVGSGSGLMSLAAKRLGMHVVSFDYDPVSVACTNRLKEKYFTDDPTWVVHQGSILDSVFLSGLGTFDVVYSWGVLHHTGDMWKALDNLFPLVADKGSVVVALYNDQGLWSKVWKSIKVIYNRLPRYLKTVFVVAVMAPRELKIVAIPLLKGKVGFVVQRWAGDTEESSRGMSLWRDMIDWVGGYPFEVAKPEEVFYLFKKRGYSLVELRTCAGELGCNEYVFEKK